MTQTSFDLRRHLFRLAAAATLLGSSWLPSSAFAQIGLSQHRLGELQWTLLYPTHALTSTVQQGPFTLNVAEGASPAQGAYRLVVLSHGTGGSAIVDHALARALVQQGLVVAQVLHQGDNHLDARDAGPIAFERRPREVSALIDALAAHPQWARRLKLDRVGVHGMSAGGSTALALAGAQWRILTLVQHCIAHGQEDIGFCLQGALTPEQRSDRQARFDAARGVPEAFLPPELKAWKGGLDGTAALAPGPGWPAAAAPTDIRPDTRIAVVTLAVPVAAIFSAESLARIAIPVGVVSAERDQVLLPRFHSEHVLRHCKSCIRLMDLPAAGHFDVLWPWPAEVARSVAAGQVRGGSPEPDFDPAQREMAQQRIAGFFKKHLH